MPTSRRRFLQQATAASAAFAACGTSHHLLGELLAAPAEQPRPNLVFFLGEGVRPDECSLAGNPLLHTPNIDRIGREGAVFQNAFVTNALCLPARATTLTGMYGHTTGAVDNQHSKVPDSFPIVSDLIRDAGYEVAFVGKSHVEGALMDRYWDYYLGFEGQADFYKPVLHEGRKGTFAPAKEYHEYVDDVLTRKAVEWLDSPHEKPFCLFLWFYAPHAPFYRPLRNVNDMNGVKIPVPKSEIEAFENYKGKPNAVRDADNKLGMTILGSDDPRSLEELVKNHYVGVENNDENIGKVFEVLDRKKVTDKTAILWCSDHGFFLGEHGLYDKRLMYEESIRVPFMLRYPPRVPAGTKSEKMVLNLDLAPTLMDLAGIKIPAATQGKSVMPLIETPAAAAVTWRKDWLYEYYEYPAFENVRPNRGIRTERYKLIHYFLEPQEFELYDLHADPEEMSNLYGNPKYAKLQARLVKRLAELRVESGDHYEYQPTVVLDHEREKLPASTM